jgi:hypothetical protein
MVEVSRHIAELRWMETASYDVSVATSLLGLWGRDRSKLELHLPSPCDRGDSLIDGRVQQGWRFLHLELGGMVEFVP